MVHFCCGKIICVQIETKGPFYNTDLYSLLHELTDCMQTKVLGGEKMRKVCETELRAVDAGATYTCTRKCGMCGKKFSVSIRYNTVFNLLGAMQVAYTKVNNKYYRHLETAH